MAKSRKKSEPVLSFSNSMFDVEGRLFGTRVAALAYCKAERISAYRIGIVRPPKVDLDFLKLSVREEWKLRVVFRDHASLVVFEHATKGNAHAFCVPLSALVELVSTVKARVRELARAGAL